MNRKRNGGFTVIELMITIVIMVILASLAAPSFSEWLARLRMTNQANQLVGDLAMARSESATRGARITVCARKTDTSCDADGNWANGWLVFVDANANHDFDKGETMLRATEGLGGNTTVTATGFTSDAYVIFLPYGGLFSSAAGSFDFCSKTTGSAGFHVAISAIGRAQASKVTTCTS